MARVVIPGFRKIEVSGSGEGGTTNYNDLTNKPSINNVPLVGNLSTVNLKLTDATLTEEGVPAEAKTVGAKLAEQSTSLTAVKEELTKKVNVSDIPTKVSELQNDSNYQTDTDVTNTLTTYATKTYVGEQISSVNHLKREIVTEIPSPETADKNTIYMLKIESATGEDKYKEYLLIDGTLQCIGDTSVDLTDYAKKTEIPTELPANGGNSLTVNGHTVKSDVPENAVFTDTVYDDTEVQKRISDNGYGEVAGGKNLIPDEDMNKLLSQMSDNIDGTTHSYSDCVLSINRVANVNSGVYVYSSIFKRFNNKKVKISFDAKSSVNGMVLSIFLNNSSYSYTPILTSEYKRYSVEVVAGGTAHNFIIYGNAVAGEVNIKNVMFSEAVYNDTSYEPYFPSNKMLSEDVDSIKNDLIVLEATSTIDMSASRELDYITSSTLTIPSGYKPIAMYGYNEENNDNISAIPLLVRSDGKVLFHAKNHSASDQGIIHFVIRVTFKKVS